MADLQNAQIDQSYPSLIKTFDNGPIDGTFKFLSDGAGNKLPIEVSNADVRILSNQIQLTDVAQVNGFAITAASAAFGGTVDFSAATVNGLPIQPAGLVAGTGTDSMASAASLTTTAGIAAGAGSIAIGDGATANDTATGGSLAIGAGANANGLLATAVGRNTVANSFGPTAIGNDAQASGQAVAIGYSARALGSGRVSIGVNSNAGGASSISIGSAAVVPAAATGAIAIGKDSDATQDGAVALGTGVQAVTANTATVNLFQIAGYAGMNYPDDATAATNGIPLGGVYHTDGALKIRIA